MPGEERCRNTRDDMGSGEMMAEELKTFIGRLVAGEDLDADEASAAMREIVSGEASPAQAGAYLVALRMKGETVPEILGSARVVRERTTPIRTSRQGLLDTCGTGGDGAASFNVSTAAALVAAGAGAVVAKHGNRSVSSRCGSADLLEACGVPLDLPAPAVAATLDAAGIAFLFAPALNGAMAAVAPLRRQLGLRTVFNLLGPLANPAGAERQLLGVYEARWVEPIAHVLAGLGSKRALVVHGLEGLDEISVSGPTQAASLVEGRVSPLTLTPEVFGLRHHAIGSLVGGSPAENRSRLEALLSGERGAVRDAVVANAGAALWVAEAAKSFEEGARMAERSLDSGEATWALHRLISVSRRCGGLS